MLLRITEERLEGATVMLVAGGLCGEGVEELNRACRAASGSLRLDLTDLQQADELGLSLLRSLRESGAKLVGVSPFIDLLLQARRTDAGI
jgi:hypothetical protein